MSVAVEKPGSDLNSSICAYTTFRDPNQTYLECPWTLWLVNKTDSGSKTWLECIHPVATFSTIQQFWGMYNSLKPPSELPSTWEYALFRGGLGRRVIVPDWDDHENFGGGCMTCTGFNLDTKVIDHLWRDICLKVIEEAWIHTSDYINGVLVSNKAGTTRYYVWVAACKEHVWDDIKDRIESVFGADCRTPIKWTPHTERKPDRVTKQTTQKTKNLALSSSKSFSGARRPRAVRCRSADYRAKPNGSKTEEEVNTDEFLAAKRRTLMENIEKNTKKLQMMDLTNNKPSAPAPTLPAFKVSSSVSCTHSFNNTPSQRRGRSAQGHRAKQPVEYPAFLNRNRGHGDGDTAGNHNKHCCHHHHHCEHKPSLRPHRGGKAREMIDVSTQFATKGGNCAVRNHKVAEAIPDDGGGDHSVMHHCEEEH